MEVGIWQLKSQFHWIYSIRRTNFDARKSIPLEKSNGSMNFVLNTDSNVPEGQQAPKGLSASRIIYF
ncbi:hypothetical protein ASD40_05230 [Paenibacillus sp. Root444D2]|nr:hypothetical protein ASD40_05230 [Paenibacillus sp. Root444D2]